MTAKPVGNTPRVPSMSTAPIPILTVVLAGAAVLAGCRDGDRRHAVRRTPANLSVAAEPPAPPPAPKPVVRYVGSEEAARLIRHTPDLFLLCVDTEEQYADGHVAGSLLIPVMALDVGIERNDWFPALNRGRTPRKDQPILVYCWWKSCVCPSIPAYSQVAAKILIRKGYTNVTVMAGGMRDWSKKGLPVETTPAPDG